VQKSENLSKVRKTRQKSHGAVF